MSDDHQTPIPLAETPELNPYAPPTTDPVLDTGSTKESESLRLPLLKHEASLKGIGALLILGGIAFALIGITSGSEDLGQGANFLMMGIMGSIGLLEIITGWFLRRFKPWARWLGVLFCALMLVNIPIGTVLGIYFLYLLCGTNGSLIFSPRYQQAIRDTPHLKYRSPLWMWILLGLLLLGLVALFVSTRL